MREEEANKENLFEEYFERFNDIIFNIYHDDIALVFKNFCDKIYDIVHYDGFFYSYFYYKQNDCKPFNFITSPNISKEDIDIYAERIWPGDCIKWFLGASSSDVFRDFDIINPSAFENTPLYKEWLAPMGFYYSTIVPVSHNGRTIVSLDLLRRKDTVDFSDRELFILKTLNKHIRARYIKEFPRGITETFYSNSNDSLRNEYFLTEREGEIAKLLSDGLTRQQVCDKLYISMNTLKKHLANLYKKLNVTNSTQFYNAISKW